MVLLRVTPTILEAVEAYRARLQVDQNTEDDPKLGDLQPGASIEHKVVLRLSKALTSSSPRGQWHVDYLLKGTEIYKPPPPLKREPTAEYKTLMLRLRKEEEQRQYDRMIASTSEKHAGNALQFDPRLSHGRNDNAAIDEVTYQDIERQLTLIINVLVTVIASGIAIWILARHWSAPPRLALSMVGSLVIAVAEVVVYTGYLRRIQDAKTTEKKKPDEREITESWVIQPATKAAGAEASGIRHRKGRHR